MTRPIRRWRTAVLKALTSWDVAGDASEHGRSVVECLAAGIGQTVSGTCRFMAGGQYSSSMNTAVRFRSASVRIQRSKPSLMA